MGNGMALALRFPHPTLTYIPTNDQLILSTEVDRFKYPRYVTVGSCTHAAHASPSDSTVALGSGLAALVPAGVWLALVPGQYRTKQYLSLLFCFIFILFYPIVSFVHMPQTVRHAGMKSLFQGSVLFGFRFPHVPGDRLKNLLCVQAGACGRDGLRYGHT